MRGSIVLLTLSILGHASHLYGGKKTLVGAKVPMDRRLDIDRIDHQRWSDLLEKYVDNDGMIDYAAWKRSPSDRDRLDQYLKVLSSAKLSGTTTREAKLAFWINAYNAVTVHGILREYPTKSIRKHTSSFGGYNIWHDYQLLVEGEGYSLDHMEHQILRKMEEPRIHFAIVCASIGCPRLLNEAYVADKLNAQLETNARDFFSRTRNFRFDSSRNRFHLSAILNWFGEDFGAGRPQQLKSISKWLPTAESKRAAISGSASVRYLKYDWNLNEQSSDR